MADDKVPRGSNGEFHFTLREKHDRNGDLYLFGALPLLNSVLFIRPDPASPEGEGKRWKAVLKPYVAAKNGDSEEEKW